MIIKFKDLDIEETTLPNNMQKFIKTLNEPIEALSYQNFARLFIQSPFFERTPSKPIAITLNRDSKFKSIAKGVHEDPNLNWLRQYATERANDAIDEMEKEVDEILRKKWCLKFERVEAPLSGYLGIRFAATMLQNVQNWF